MSHLTHRVITETISDFERFLARAKRGSTQQAYYQAQLTELHNMLDDWQDWEG